jgi:hypothetical protein
MCEPTDCEVDLNGLHTAWRPTVIAAAKPYFKAVGLLMTLMIVWLSLCTI